MSYEIVLRAKAERAIDRAAEWYERRNPDAAREFVVAVGAIIVRIKENHCSSLGFGECCIAPSSGPFPTRSSTG
jgi:hypothetical protein